MIDFHCIEHQRQIICKSGLSTKRHYATKHAENNTNKIKEKRLKNVLLYFMIFLPELHY